MCHVSDSWSFIASHEVVSRLSDSGSLASDCQPGVCAMFVIPGHLLLAMSLCHVRVIPGHWPVIASQVCVPC